jgi:hypothetical protein
MFAQLKRFLRRHDRATRRSARRLAFGPRVKALQGRRLPSTFTSTNGKDPGAGSLRQAILDGDAASGSNAIAFDSHDSGMHTIMPPSPLR